MSVLLTGGTGFIGRAVLEAGGDTEWVALTRSGAPDWGRELKNVEWVEADLSQPGFEASLPSAIDAVVHLARSRRQRDPNGAQDVHAVNVAATAGLLEWAAGAEAGRFVLGSTASIYRASSEPLREDAPLEPTDLYNASKRDAERLLDAYARALPGVALRIFTPYGPGQRGQLIAELIEKVRSGEPITVQGERGLLISPIHVDDIVAAVLAALKVPLEEGPPEAINVGGPDSLGIKEIGEAIGAELEIEPRFEPTDGPEPGGFVVDRTHATDRLDTPDPTPFRDGLKRTLEAESTAAG